MNRGDIIFFIDVGQRGSLVSPRLPLSIYKGPITGVGSTLITVRTRFGTICFDQLTGKSLARDFQMFNELKFARRIIKARKANQDAILSRIQRKAAQS